MEKVLVLVLKVEINVKQIRSSYIVVHIYYDIWILCVKCTILQQCGVANTSIGLQVFIQRCMEFFYFFHLLKIINQTTQNNRQIIILIADKNILPIPAKYPYSFFCSKLTNINAIVTVTHNRCFTHVMFDISSIVNLSFI